MADQADWKGPPMKHVVIVGGGFAGLNCARKSVPAMCCSRMELKFLVAL
jgi:hypothetical protein